MKIYDSERRCQEEVTEIIAMGKRNRRRQRRVASFECEMLCVRARVATAVHACEMRIRIKVLQLKQ